MCIDLYDDDYRDTVMMCDDHILRSLSGSQWFSRNDVFRKGLCIPDLTYFVRSLTLTHFFTVSTFVVRHIRDVCSAETYYSLPPIRVNHPRAIVDYPP